MLRARRVRNLAAIIYSFEQQSFLKHISSPSLSERERQFQCFVRSYMVNGKEGTGQGRKTRWCCGGVKERREKKTVSPTPKETNKPQALHVTLSREGKRSLTRRDSSSRV
ncbi:hypothetical protein ACB092_11G109700 [Castanea dentata]